MLEFNETVHKESKKTNNQDEKYIVEGKIEVSAENIFFAIENFKTSLTPGTVFAITNVFLIKGNDSIIDITEYFKKSQ